MMNHTECFTIHRNHGCTLENIHTQMTETGMLTDMSEFFKCFADPTRLKIINALLLSEMCVCELQRIMQMTQPAISHHLKHLRQSRLVKCRRNKRAIYYSLNDYHIQLLFDLTKSHLSEKQS